MPYDWDDLTKKKRDSEKICLTEPWEKWPEKLGRSESDIRKAIEKSGRNDADTVKKWLDGH